MTTKCYIAYDSRAAGGDSSDACILECIGEVSEERAIEVWKEEWKDQGGVLMSYDTEGDTLVNELLVMSTYMLEDSQP